MTPKDVCGLLNAGDVAKARQRIAAIPAAPDRRFEKACLLEALSGSLELTDPRQCEPIVKEAIGLLAGDIPNVAPHAVAERRQLLEDWQTALQYYGMMRYAAAYRETKKDSYRRYEEAALLAGTILPEEPAYWQAELLRARLYCWLGIEGNPASAQHAKPIIENLYKHFPDHRIVRLYSNQPVASLRPPLPEPPAGAPDWAVRERELLTSILGVGAVLGHRTPDARRRTGRRLERRRGSVAPLGRGGVGGRRALAEQGHREDGRWCLETRIGTCRSTATPPTLAMWSIPPRMSPTRSPLRLF